MPSLDELKAKIIAACDRALEQGYTFRTRTWGVARAADKWNHYSDEKRICPMGAVLLHLQPDTEHVWPNGPMEGAAKALGVESCWVRAFIRGFDGGVRLKGADGEFHPTAYDLGVELREKYKAEWGPGGEW